MARPVILSGVDCYHCQSPQTSKAGFDKGKQRFYCRSCRRFFRERPFVPSGNKRNRNRNRDRNRKSLPSEGHLILNLQAIAQSLKKTPTTSDINELSKAGRSYPLGIYYEVFGSFLEALKKAGLQSNYKQKFDKEKLLGELKRLRAKLKRPLLGKDVVAARKRGKISSLYHFQRAFGSVPQAIEAANAGRKTYSREEMIEILRTLDGKLSRPVHDSDIDELYHRGEGPNHRAIEREFGGMREARRAAGIKNSYRLGSGSTLHWQRYAPEELIEQLKALGESLGRKPTNRDINEASKKGLCASATTFSRMFGNLPEAYRKAGFEKAKPRSYTDGEILTALKTLIKEKGRMPTYHEIKAASKAGVCPSPGTITLRLGKLSELKSKFEKT